MGCQPNETGIDMNANVWTGDKVRLRAREASDWEAQRRWRADTDGERDTRELVGTMSTESDPMNGTFSYELYLAPAEECNRAAHAYNEPSIGLHKAMGFQVKGRRAGADHDLVRLGMKVEELHDLYSPGGG
jgi:hypothetical protein